MVSITSALVSITSSMVSITSALVSITSALGNLSGARTAIRRATPCWMSNTLSSGLPSGARSLRREPPPIQRRYRSKRVRLGSPACIQQEGFCAPCGGVEAKTHNIAAVGGNGARCIKTRPATQQAGISGVQVFHSTGGRPAKGAECPQWRCEPVRPPPSRRRRRHKHRCYRRPACPAISTKVPRGVELKPLHRRKWHIVWAVGVASLLVHS
jgi:hypothetical protein